MRHKQLTITRCLGSGRGNITTTRHKRKCVGPQTIKGKHTTKKQQEPACSNLQGMKKIGTLFWAKIK